MAHQVDNCANCPALHAAHADYIVCKLTKPARVDLDGPHRRLDEPERDALRTSNARGGTPFFPTWCPLHAGPVTLEAPALRPGGKLSAWRRSPTPHLAYRRVDGFRIPRAEVFLEGGTWRYRVWLHNGVVSMSAAGDDILEAARLADACLRRDGFDVEGDTPCVDALNER